MAMPMPLLCTLRRDAWCFWRVTRSRYEYLFSYTYHDGKPSTGRGGVEILKEENVVWTLVWGSALSRMQLLERTPPQKLDRARTDMALLF